MTTFRVIILKYDPGMRKWAATRLLFKLWLGVFHVETRSPNASVGSDRIQVERKNGKTINYE